MFTAWQKQGERHYVFDDIVAYETRQKTCSGLNGRESENSSPCSFSICILVRFISNATREETTQSKV